MGAETIFRAQQLQFTHMMSFQVDSRHAAHCRFGLEGSKCVVCLPKLGHHLPARPLGQLPQGLLEHFRWLAARDQVLVIENDEAPILLRSCLAKAHYTFNGERALAAA